MRNIVQRLADYLVEQQRRISYELRQLLGIKPRLMLNNSLRAHRPAAGAALEMFSTPNTQLTLVFE